MTTRFDSFTAPDGTPLTIHTADGGLGTWQNHALAVPVIENDCVQIPLGNTNAEADTGVAIDARAGLDISLDFLFPRFEGPNASLSLVLSQMWNSLDAVVQFYWNDNYYGGLSWEIFFGVDGDVVLPIPTGPLRLGVRFLPDGTVTVYTAPYGGGARTIIGTSTFTDSLLADSHPSFQWGDSGVSTAGFIDSFTVTYALLSSITAVPDTIEAGTEESTVTVTAKDNGGNPIVGATVVISATGTGNTITQPESPTDASGVAVGYLRSTKAEAKTVSATANGTALGVTTTVTVTPGPPDPDHSYLEPSSLRTTAGALGTAIGIYIRDQYGNGVPGQTPNADPTGGTATPPGPTGPDGGTTTTYTPPTSSGPQTLTISIVNLELPITVDPGPLYAFGITVPAEVMRGGQTAVACVAQDQYGNRVTSFTGRLDLTATGTGLLGTPVRTSAFVAGRSTPNLVFLDVASGCVVHGAEVGGAHTGTSNTFAVIEPWGPRAHPGGSFAARPAAAGVWRPEPDREWEDRDG